MPAIQLRARSLRRRSVFALRAIFLVGIIAFAIFSIRRPLRAQSHEALSQPTQYRVLSEKWWPTSGAAPISAYAGTSACRQCHADKVKTQITTPMSAAAYHGAVGVWGSKLTPSSTRLGPFFYKVSTRLDDPSLTVSLGTQSIEAEIGWTFGAGVRGQTFVVNHKGSLYDSQVSTFPGLHGRMAITPGHVQKKGDTIEEALGTNLRTDGPRCFGCHTTASSTKGEFDPEQAIPGITCEGCHGPGLAHVVAANMNVTSDARSSILNPARLTPIESVDFCGACHTTSADVIEFNLFGPNNIRFQPYRLEKSRCWGTQGDRRLACFACHDPHQPVVHDAAFYDQRCLSCHSSTTNQPSAPAGAAHAVCPKATTNCVSCHMPKYDEPEMHAKFTDHFIHIVRPDEGYPTR